MTWLELLDKKFPPHSRVGVPAKGAKGALAGLAGSPLPAREGNNSNPQPPGNRPFDRAALDRIQAGEPVRVWSGAIGCWLYWVRGEAERDRLVASGIDASLIYMLGELRAVAGRGFTPEDIRRMHAIKREFDGTFEPSPRPAA